jgi:enamine deaminase RidA (YjgF/YER057c/UK114 family)
MAVEQGAEAAKRCAISLLAQLKKACDGDLSRVVRAVKLTGFVNSTADFTDQPKVINGASDFLVAAPGRCRPPRPLGGLGRLAAPRRRGRDRRPLRDPLMPPASPCPPVFLRLPLAHRALHDRRRRAGSRIRPPRSAPRWTAGYAIEIDVQLSQDGRPMVFHDETWTG